MPTNYAKTFGLAQFVSLYKGEQTEKQNLSKCFHILISVGCFFVKGSIYPSLPCTTWLFITALKLGPCG
jgi:hypothetical protein